jgi:hypothetical protein
MLVLTLPGWSSESPCVDVIISSACSRCDTCLIIDVKSSDSFSLTITTLYNYGRSLDRFHHFAGPNVQLLC